MRAQLVHDKIFIQLSRGEGQERWKPGKHTMLNQVDQVVAMNVTNAQRYEVQVNTHLDCQWLDYLPVAEKSNGSENDGATRLVLQVVDQAELMGIMNMLHGLGLCLLSVKRLEA